MSPIRAMLRLSAVAMISLVFLQATCAAWGQDADNGDKPKIDAPTVADELALRQGQLADRFAHLEKMMFRLAEYDVGEKPRRSALLRQALRQSRDRYIANRFESLVKLLNQQQLSPAVKSQADLRIELEQLLELLMTENRPDRLKTEQQRVRDYIKEVDRILRLQRSVQGRTEGGEDTDRLSRDQAKVAQRTRKLSDTIEENEQVAGGRESDEDGNDRPSSDESDASSKGKPGEQQDQEQPPSRKGSQSKDEDPEPASEDASDQTESDPREGSQAENSSEQSEPSPSKPSDSPSQEQGKGQQGQPSQGQPIQGQPSQPGQQGDSDQQSEQSQQQDFPGRQKIAAAEEKMREAQQRLAEAKREGAVKEQEEARRLLEEAKAELEEILRQLREEEIERMLALLEGRFRKMLEMQLRVYENTKRVDKIPAGQRGREIDIQAGKLSLEERRIVAEADKALALLREEGSSVAFPEVVQQMQEDMRQVVGLLAKTRIGRITQGIEEDIIAALEEMIEALQQAQQDQEQRQQQQQPPSSSSEQDQGLVDAIAELKLIKSLQLRVNKRTQRYSRLLDDPEEQTGQLVELDLIQEIKELSNREQRIVKTTRDIVLGRNK